MGDHETLINVAKRWEAVAAELKAENEQLREENERLRAAVGLLEPEEGT